MALTIAPLFSSSAGNCTYIEAGNTAVLVDAGVAGNQVEQALNSLGKKAGNLKAIIISHEHSDHIKGAGVLSRKYDIPIFANTATWEQMRRKVGEIAVKNVRLADGEFFVGDLCMSPFAIHHDSADAVGYCIYSGAKKIAIMTDTGKVTEKMIAEIAGAQVVLLESNHDINMLKSGKYPAHLKKRILSNHGHLSNEDSAAVAFRLCQSGTKGLLLAHLSRENNYPELAYKVVATHLTANGITIGADIALATTKKFSPTGIYEV